MSKNRIFNNLLSIALSFVMLSQGIMLETSVYAESLPAETVLTQGWDFEDNMLIDWTAQGFTPTIEKGMVSFTSTADCYLENTAEIDADIFKYLVVKARSNSSDDMKFSFKTNGETEYGTAIAIPMSATTDEFKGFTKYVFDLSENAEWTGTYTQGKLSFGTAAIDIEDITFYSAYDIGKTAKEYHIPVTADEQTSQGTKLTMYGTTLGGFDKKSAWDISALESTGRAMVLWFTELSLPTDTYDKMIMKLKTNKNVMVSSPFIKITESKDWVTSIPSPTLTADGEYTYYVIDLSEVDGYSGNLTEMQFRISLTENEENGFTAEIADVFVADAFVPSKNPGEIDSDTIDKIGLYTYDDEITEESGTVMLTPYLRYADGRESDDVKLVKWSVSDENIAKVNDSGVVTGNNNGTVTVRAAYRLDESLFDEVTIKVSGQTIPYTVTYDKNTSDTVTNMPKPNKWAKTGFTFDKVFPERRNYRFLGWALTPDGEVVESVDVTEDITVYAKWAEIPAVPISWSFETGLEGWSVGGDAQNLRIENGAAVMDITGGDPEFVSPDMSDGNIALGDGSDDTFNYIRLRIKNKTNGPATGKIFFATATHNLNGSNDNVSFSIPNNTNDYVDVFVRMTDASEWKGTLKQFRIDGVDGTPAATKGTIMIDEIELMSISNEAFIFNKEFDDADESDALAGVSKWDNTISRVVDPTNADNKVMKVNVTNRYGNWAIPASFEKGDKYKFKYKIKRLADTQLILREVIYGTDNQLLSQRIPSADWTTNQSTFTVSHDTAKSVGIFSEGTGLGEYLVDNVTLTRFDDFAICDKSRIKDDAKDVDIYDNINILFNETVSVPDCDNVHIYDKENNEITVNEVLANQTTLSVKHEALQSNTEYTLVIDTISDNGGRTAENVCIKFRTKDDIEVSGLEFTSVSGNSATVTGTIVNNLNTPQTLILKLWEYGNSTMTALPQEHSIIVNPGVNTISKTFENITDNAKTVSSSVWIDNENIRPVSKSINSGI